ncbi:MAG: class I SAM-dependent methyltransferase [Saprospiraceae bacterium]|nr:class I SAM-dependent methyltransferase [Saprospiraceae bacterium]
MRINPVKATLDQVRNALKKEGWETIPLGPLSLELEERANVFRTEAFKAGWFEVQDFASQQVALALEISPGQRVVDGCAGAGGKTLQIGALLENRGQVIALDPDEWKLKELKRRARRGGLDNIQARLSTDTKAVKRLHQSAERVLLDVPAPAPAYCVETRMRSGGSTRFYLTDAWLAEANSRTICPGV